VNVRIQKSRKDDWLSHWEAFNYVPFRKKSGNSGSLEWGRLKPE
jgi:hypothetical protein